MLEIDISYKVLIFILMLIILNSQNVNYDKEMKRVFLVDLQTWI